MMFIDTAVIGRNHKEKRQPPPRLMYLTIVLKVNGIKPTRTNSYHYNSLGFIKNIKGWCYSFLMKKIIYLS